MLKKTLLSAVSAASLFLLPQATMAANTSTVTSADSSVKPSHHEALQAAAWILSEEVKNEEKSNWKGKSAKLEEPQEVYDPAGNLVGYLVNLIASDGKYQGHVLVSASYDSDPILAWADGGKRISTELDKQKVDASGEKVKSSQLVWLGGDDFVSRFHLKDGSSVLVDRDGNQVPNSINQAFPSPSEKNDTARSSWDSIKHMSVATSPGVPNKNQLNNVASEVWTTDPATFEQSYSSISRGYVDTTINFAQYSEGTIYDPSTSSYKTVWSGCAPTAGSDIIEYWAQHGYQTFDLANNQHNVVESLRQLMGTTTVTSGTEIGACSTSIANIPGGLQQYANTHGDVYALSTNISSPYFSDVTDEIDSGRPAELDMIGQPYYGGHSVFLLGYKHFIRSAIQVDSYYAVVRNNWGDGTINEYVKWGSWNSATLTIFLP